MCDTEALERAERFLARVLSWNDLSRLSRRLNHARYHRIRARPEYPVTDYLVAESAIAAARRRLRPTYQHDNSMQWNNTNTI